MPAIDFPVRPFHGQEYYVPSMSCTYIYDKTRDSWYFSPIAGTTGGGTGGGAGVIISEQPPSTANNGDLWIDSITYYMYTFDASVDNTGRWIGITNNGGDNSYVHMGIDPPSGNVGAGQFWFDTESGDLRVLYVDNNSQQWVTITSNGMSIGSTATIIKILEAEIEDLNGRLDGLETNVQGIVDGNEGILLE